MRIWGAILFCMCFGCSAIHSGEVLQEEAVSFAKGSHAETEVGGYAHNAPGGGVRLKDGSVNLIQNGGFEEWAEKAPAAWEFISTPEVLTSATRGEKQSPQGNFYLSMQAGPLKDVPDRYSRWNLEKKITLPEPWPGGTLKLTFFARQDHLIQRKPVFLSIDIFDSSEKRLYEELKILYPEKEWKEFQIVLEPPRGSKTLKLSIRSPGKQEEGALCFDDFQLRTPSFVKKGSYTSEAMDLGKRNQGLKIRWLADLPGGTALKMWIRSGDSKENWNEWRRVEDIQTFFPSVAGRFFQYRADLETRDSRITPSLRRVSLSWDQNIGAVAGRVLHGKTRVPIVRAEVRSADKTVTSDEKGCFLLPLAPGTHQVTVKRFGYRTSAVLSLDVKPRGVLPQDVLLTPKGDWPIPRGSLRHLGQTFLSGRIQSPHIRWRYDLGPQRADQVLTEDLDGDGKLEILIKARCRIFAYHCDGTLLWEIPPNLGNEETRIFGVFDINRDGTRDIVVVSPGFHKLARAYILSAKDGRVQWMMDTFTEPDYVSMVKYGLGHYSFFSVETTKVVDLNGDGWLDLICQPDNYIYLRAVDFSGGFDKAKILYDAPMKLLNHHPRQLVADDLDRDGKLEVVGNANQGGKLMAFDAATGEFICSMTLEHPANSPPILAANIDKDPSLELIFMGGDQSITAFDFKERKLEKKWEQSAKDKKRSREFYAADLDGDSISEIILEEGGDVVIWNGEGQPVGRIEKATLLKVADLDKDGKAEICVKQNGQKAYFSFDKGKIASEADIHETEGVDLDGDGKLEILENGVDGFLHILDEGRKEKLKIPTGRYFWRNNTTFLAALAADLDNDGRNEVIIQDSSRNYKVLNAEGASLENPPKVSGTLVASAPIPQFLDLDGDGRMELLGSGVARVVRDDKKGFYLEQIKEWNPEGVSGTSAGDFDGDGTLDLLLLIDQSRKGKDRYCLALSGKDNSVLWKGGSEPFTPFGYYYPGIADLTEDGIDDIAGKGPATAHVKDGRTGESLWAHTRWEMCACGLAAIEDLDGDENLDVVVLGGAGNTGWTGKEGKGFFGIKYRPSKGRYGCLADVDNDGRWDIGLATGHGKFYCMNGETGSKRWEFELQGKPDMSNPCAADIDGDGKLEFLFGAMDGLLYCLNSEDGTVCWTYRFGEGVGDPIVADVDRDGFAEVLVVVDGWLYCLN